MVAGDNYMKSTILKDNYWSLLIVIWRWRKAQVSYGAAAVTTICSANTPFRMTVRVFNKPSHPFQITNKHTRFSAVCNKPPTMAFKSVFQVSHVLKGESVLVLILTIGCWSPAAYRVCESCLCCPRCARRWRGLWGKSSGWYWQGWPFLETEWCNRMILLGGEGTFGENQVDDTENWQGTWLGTLLMPNTPWNN